MNAKKKVPEYLRGKKAEGDPPQLTILSVPMLRDYFAGRAMQSMIASNAGHGEVAHLGEWRKTMAAHAYAIADAMLEERVTSVTATTKGKP